MTITDKLAITRKASDGTIVMEMNGACVVVPSTDPKYAYYLSFYKLMYNNTPTMRARLYEDLLKKNRYPEIFGTTENKPVTETEAEAKVPSKEEVLIDGLSKLMNFFTEFNFTPSFRFTNTFSYMASQSPAAAKEYVINYFALMDNGYTSEVKNKMQSKEFTEIVKSISQYGVPNDHINKRLKIYYGSAGTGKTTMAMTEAENRCVVCNASMLPSDLMEDFLFKDGRPDFNPSLLWECMEQGKPIVLDEINLLPFDSLRFLQGIVDGKTEFYYKNRAVHIHDGFEIIGTMNLSLGGMVYGLPEPLVDRCYDMKEYALTAEQLAKAILRAEGE